MKHCIPEIIALAIDMNGATVERHLPPHTPCEEVKVALLTEGFKNPVCIRRKCAKL
jgi:hypothetical protein